MTYRYLYTRIINNAKLIKNTALIPLPELEIVIKQIKEFLTENVDLCDINTYDNLMVSLDSVRYNFRVCENYLHEPPYEHSYPYLPTINVIEKSMHVVDSVVRKQYYDLYDYYHSNRYMYHFCNIYNFKYLYIPTIKNLTIKDFNNIRPYPLGYIGISFKPEFSDGYYNTPLDFFYHDVNHVRRLESGNMLYCKKNNIDTNNILQNIDLYDAINVVNKEILKKIDNIGCLLTREILHLLYFEFTHEFAYVPDKNLIKEALLHEPYGHSPFEHIISVDFCADDLETLRMKNGNIYSGHRQFNNYDTIRYFYDNGPSFITSCYNKVNNRFYFANELKISKEEFSIMVRLFLDIVNIELTMDKIEDLLDLNKYEKILEKYPNEKLIVPNKYSNI